MRPKVITSQMKLGLVYPSGLGLFIGGYSRSLGHILAGMKQKTMSRRNNVRETDREIHRRAPVKPTERREEGSRKQKTTIRQLDRS